MSGQIPAGDVAGVRGKERGSIRGPRATCGRSRGGSRRSEESCPRRTGPAAGGARRRGASGGRRWKRTGWGGSIGHGEAHGAVNLGRRKTGRQVPRRPEVTAALGETAALYARGGDRGCQFIGKRIDGELLVS
jgi:hypothetical protein